MVSVQDLKATRDIMNKMCQAGSNFNNIYNTNMFPGDFNFYNIKGLRVLLKRYENKMSSYRTIQTFNIFAVFVCLMLLYMYTYIGFTVSIISYYILYTITSDIDMSVKRIHQDINKMTQKMVPKNNGSCKLIATHCINAVITKNIKFDLPKIDDNIRDELRKRKFVLEYDNENHYSIIL